MIDALTTIMEKAVRGFPEICVCAASRLDQAVRELAAERFVVRLIRGHRACDKTSLLCETAAAMQFPHYFGNNFDAMDECLADLLWPDACTIIVVLANAVVAAKNSDTEFRTYLEVWRDWVESSTSKRVLVLHAEPYEIRGLGDRLERLGFDTTRVSVG